MTASRDVLVVPERGWAELPAHLEAGCDRIDATSVETAEAALARLKSGSVDCLVTGLDLPEESGRALVERTRETSPSVPVVVATAAGSEVAASEVAAAGADRYVPLGAVEVDELVDHVVSVLDEETIQDREQYETIVETVPDGVFVLDEGSTILRVNETGARMLGFEAAADAVGTPLPELVENGVIETEAVDRYTELVSELLSDRNDRATGRLELSAWPDGDERVYQANVAPRPYRRSFRGTVGILRDVTDRKRREDELQQYETIIEAIPDAVWTIDANAEYVYVNEAMYELTGYETAKTRGENARIGMTEEGFQRANEVIRRLLSAEDPLGPSATFEHELVRKDGRVLLCETHLALLPFAEEYRGAAGITRDVTDRKMRVRRLKLLNRVLRHNLRNDLTTVIELADLVGHESDDPDLREYADRIRETAFGLVGTSDKIRTAQKAIESGKSDPETVALDSIVDDVAETYREDHPEATITVDAPDDIWVEANESLRLALSNVVENAIVHNDTPNPTVGITVTTGTTPPRQSASSSVTPTDWVAVRVTDDGPGIPSHERDVITGNAEVTQLTHSSGVGLLLVDWIVTSVGGQLRIEDGDGGEAGPGSTVALFLKQAD